jgi:putative nucleotidyltransferase with HDIG domain
MTKEEIAVLEIKTLITGTRFADHVFCVGGMVRDQLMGHPIKDIDLVVDLPNGGVEFADFMVDTYPKICKNKCLFQTYGTAKFTMQTIMGDVDIETVHTRKEQYKNKNSRNPETEFGTLLEDASRRDLTINALYKNVSDDKIIDPTGKGVDDIKNQIIRTPCDPVITFSDDPLRMMRVIRFSCRYNWEIEKNTLKAIKEMGSRISIISKERIADELEKILVCEHPVEGLLLLQNTGLLKEILPEVEELIGVDQGTRYHFGDVFQHTMAVVNNTKPIFVNRLAALLHDIGKPKTRIITDDGDTHFYGHDKTGVEIATDIMKRLKLSTDIIDDVCFVIKEHMRTKSFKDDVCVTDKVIRKLQSDLGDRIDLVLDIIHADNLSHSQEYCMPNQVSNIRKRISELKEKGLDCPKIVLPVNGDDVMEIMGISPGPQVRKVLDYLKEKYLENPNITRDECIDIMGKIIHPPIEPLYYLSYFTYPKKQ